jgi:uncharacterized Ntn-hydrolase superfamily protein
LAADPGSAGRQVAVVDVPGWVAAHTGETCTPFAGHLIGEGVACQANIMANDMVWPSMLDAFATASGSLTARLLAALDAGEAAGGDVRGLRPAAVVVGVRGAVAVDAR